MKISRQDSHLPDGGRFAYRRAFSMRRELLAPLSLLLVLGLLAAGYGLGWHVPLARYLRSQVLSIWSRSSLPTLYLDVAFQDAQRLQAQRQHALATGAYIPAPGEAISATARLADQLVPIQIDLLGGIVEPGQAGGWKIKLATLNGRALLGWRHLGLSPWSMAAWGLGANLELEGGAGLSVQPVWLVLNGDALGLYGAWPASVAELIAQRDCPDQLSESALDCVRPGSVAYFDYTLYWQEWQRQRGEGLSPTLVDLSNCQAAVARTWDGSPGASEAVSLLSDLQGGSRAPSDVLDVERVATWLALATLWQGNPPGDWTGLAFYLDPATARLEPIVRGEQLSAASSGELEWPACFDDPLIQAAYVRALERISRPDYLQWLRAELGQPFELVQGLGGEPELGWDELAARQERIARWLRPSQAVWASWAAPQVPAPDAVVRVSLANLQRVPVHVLGFDLGQSTFLPLDPAWVEDGQDVLVEGDLGAEPAGGILLRAADGRRQRFVSLALPYTRVFSAARAPGESLDIRVLTQLSGQARRQSAPVRLSLKP
ncbi:MAG: hypothetical protein JW850_14530 [Thermoflexales bacterium]|nr:hypothetical protein [Thermoflexales bacterium]